MQINADFLSNLCGNKSAPKYADAMLAACSYYGINTPTRQAAFMAQISHESGGLRFMVENLNYSQDALRRVFWKYFPTAALAAKYAYKPILIGSRVYANRMGNGDEASQEGYKFRGRGVIQLTGKNNYTKFANSVEKPLDEVVPYLETPEGACMAGAWFWHVNGLNDYADREDFVGLTRRINGGTNGLDDRLVYWAKAKRLLGC